MISREVAKDGRTLVWFYAPGLLDGETIDEERIGATTGIRVVRTSLARAPDIALRAPFDTAATYSAGSPVAPLFAVDDAGARASGVFTETGQTAIARKVFRDHVAWYIALPAKTVEPLRTILQQSGAHVYSRQGDIVYDGAGVLVVHAREGGEHRVVLRSGKEVAFTLPDGATTLALDSQTGEVLLPDPWRGP